KRRRSTTPATARRCSGGIRISAAHWWTGSNARCYDEFEAHRPFFMRSDNVVYALAGVAFGVIAGWIIGAQQASPRAPAPATAIADSAPAPAATGTSSGTRA